MEYICVYILVVVDAKRENVMVRTSVHFMKHNFFYVFQIGNIRLLDVNLIVVHVVLSPLSSTEVRNYARQLTYTNIYRPVKAFYIIIQGILSVGILGKY